MYSHDFPLFSRNGVISPTSEAVIPLTNIEYSYGFGVYESLRVSDGKVLFLLEHSGRLLASAKILDIPHAVRKQEIETWTRELCHQLPTETYNIKILLIGGKTAAQAQMFILPLNPIFPEKYWYKQGVETMTVEFERPLPTAKTLNMLQSYLARRKAKEHGCYEALSLRRDGCVYEGTRSNFFTVKDNAIITPPSNTILEGVTRKYVLQLAKENGIDVKQERIAQRELQKYDGAFLTSTSAKIMPIRKIDDREYAIPDITKKLMELYNALLRNQKN